MSTTQPLATIWPRHLEQDEWLERLEDLAARAEALAKRKPKLQQCADLALEAFSLLWVSWGPELVAASCRASVLLGEGVIAGRPMSDQLLEVEERRSQLMEEHGSGGKGAVVVRPPLCLQPPTAEPPASPAPIDQETAATEPPPAVDADETTRPGPGWLSVKEASEQLGVSRKALHDARLKGELGAEGEGWLQGDNGRGKPKVWLSVETVERLQQQQPEKPQPSAVVLPAELPEWLGTTRAAELLGVRPERVRKWVKSDCPYQLQRDVGNGKLLRSDALPLLAAALGVELLEGDGPEPGPAPQAPADDSQGLAKEVAETEPASSELLTISDEASAAAAVTISSTPEPEGDGWDVNPWPAAEPSSAADAFGESWEVKPWPPVEPSSEGAALVEPDALQQASEHPPQAADNSWEWLTPDEAMELLEIDRQQLQALVMAGRFGEEGEGWQLDRDGAPLLRFAMVEALAADRPLLQELAQQEPPEAMDATAPPPAPAAATQPPADHGAPAEPSSAADDGPAPQEAAQGEPEPPAGPLQAADAHLEPRPQGDGQSVTWLKAEPLAEALAVSRATVFNWKRRGVLDGLWRPTVTGEGKGYLFDLERCRAAVGQIEVRRIRRQPPAPQGPAVEPSSSDQLAVEPSSNAASPEPPAAAPTGQAAGGGSDRVVALLEQLVAAIKAGT